MAPTVRAHCVTSLALLAAAVATVPAAAHGTKTKTLEIVHPWCFDRFEKETRDVVVGMTIRNIGPRDDALVSARMPSGESAGVVAAPGSATGAGIAIPRGSALVAYDTFPLTLVFKRAGAIKVDVMVEETVK